MRSIGRFVWLVVSTPVKLRCEVTWILTHFSLLLLILLNSKQILTELLAIASPPTIRVQLRGNLLLPNPGVSAKERLESLSKLVTAGVLDWGLLCVGGWSAGR